jgi:hypothetical protein
MGEVLLGRGGYVNAQVSIAIVRSSHHCLRGLSYSNQPNERDRRPQWKATPDSVFTVITPRSSLNCHFAERSSRTSHLRLQSRLHIILTSNVNHDH